MSAILFSQDCEQKNQNSDELQQQQMDNHMFSEDNCNGFCVQLSQSMPRTPSIESQLKDSPNAPFAAMPKQMEYSCDDSLLSNKMAALEIKEADNGHCDGGSDSGLDTATSKPATVTIAVSEMHSNLTESVAIQSNTLQRALSSTSGGYASSTGGINDANNQISETTESSVPAADTPTTQGVSSMSRNLSLYSCDSEAVGAELSTNTTNGGASSATHSFECFSENGSETSSMLGGGTAATTPVRRSNSVKTKMRAFEAGRNVYSTPITRSVRERDCSSTPISVKSTSTPSSMQSGGAAASRTRPVGIKRTSSLSRQVPSATLQRQADKQQSVNTTNKTSIAAPTSTVRSTPSTRATKPQKPDSLPNTLSRTQSMSMQRLVQRTPSLSRARTPCTPSEDGRWPGNSRASGTAMGAAKRGVSVAPDMMSLKMRSSNMIASMEVRSTNSNTSTNPYGTLPRRRKQKSVEDLTGTPDSRSSSITRDARMTTSVMASTRRSLVSAFGAATPHSSQARSLTQARKATAQPSKTRIYHETSVQTAITGDDLVNMFAGRTPTTRAVDAVEQHHQTTQTDIRDAELERLRDEVRQLAQREHELSTKLQREREEKLATQRELHLNTERVMSMLEMARIAGRKCGRNLGGSVSGISMDGDATTPTSDEGSGSGHDSLLMLESQIQMSGHELIERQHEIGQLRQLCRTLQLEMERSLAAQECLLQEKAAIEQESSELQDFLQHEKSALCDALKELENEHQTCKQQLAGREEEVKVLRDECRHLVRLNEQRRQENRMLQSKYAALENKSKEIMMQQNYSVSGASAALSGLHSRLDSLVEQLVSTYNITEHDLEDIGFQLEMSQQNHSNAADLRSTHNSDECLGRLPSNVNANGLELCTHSQKCLPQPSDGSLSPQRNQSFIAAVISAIRNATTPSSKKLLTRNNGKRISIDNAGTVELQNGQGSTKTNNYNGETQNGCGDDSDSTEMLDSETEPCLMMDNVLEDVTMPDSHSHNMVSSCTGIISQLEIPTELVIPASGDESLHNLSQAIVNRQQMELQISNMQTVQKAPMQLNQCEHDNSDEISCHDSVAEMPSLMEYCTAQAVVDQVIEVDCLVTKLLKVLRLIQMDNDNCIQQLIVDKNKLQENKEDMLEKLKELQDVNIKLQDELMDATQELMLKNTDLSNTKAEMQRHRNEIDRLTQDICNLSTLCSNYKKLSPTVEFSPLQQQLLHSVHTSAEGEINGKGAENDAESILNLLKMWQSEGQFKHLKIRNFLAMIMRNHNCMPETHQQDKCNNERLRVYANQLENVLSVLQACEQSSLNYADIQKLRYDIEVVKANANWSNIIIDSGVVEMNCNNAKPLQASNNINEDVNANATGDREKEVN